MEGRIRLMEITFFSGWILISLLVPAFRRRHACGVPETFDMKDEGLYGIVWQTKVERQKNCTRFAVRSREGRDVRRRLDGGRQAGQRPPS